MKTYIRFSIVLLSITLGLFANAETKPTQTGNSAATPKTVGCRDMLKPGGQYRLIWSGRDISNQKDIQEYADLLLKDGGVLEQLGISRPEQIIQFMAGQELNTLSANNGLPVGHWHDGANIVNSGKGKGVIYEMVLPGQATRHSIYRDDLSVKKQFSIINHVAGHNHFGMHTMWQVNTVEANQAAYDFDKFLEELKKTHDRDEISQWYQFLLSLTYAQDVVHGDSNTPDDFIRKSSEGKSLDGSPIKTDLRHPRHPTANILQAFVANLPSNMPEWKKEVAARFEKSNRYIPGAVRTKIMNEGFATLMQELLPTHTPFRTFDHAMEYCCLIGGVVAGGIQNPYWLGLEGWRNIRRAFNQRPEIANLSAIERDRAFIKYATVEVIQKMDDAEFLRLGLTDDWIKQQNFALTRVVNPDEWDHNLPPDRDPKKNFQYMIVSRDPHRVREQIILSTKGMIAFQIPRPLITDLASDGNGIIQMQIVDHIGINIPLDKASVAQTLYVMARIMQMPVSLESTVSKPVNIVRQPNPDFYMSREEYADATTEKKRLRITVSTNGQVQAEYVKRNGSDSAESVVLTLSQVPKTEGVKIEYVEDKKLASEYQAYLDLYKKDLDLASTSMKDLLPRNMAQSVDDTVSSITNGVPPHLLVSIPTVPHALQEYWVEVKSRALKALQLAVLGQRGIHHSFKGVRVKVLPDIPYFEFDKNEVQEFLRGIPAPRPDQIRRSIRAHVVSDKFSGDTPTDVVPIEGQPPRKFWGSNPNGEGEGDGDGDDGDSDPGPNAGEGGNDPSYVEFDLNTYADALGAFITLPNLRPKEGPTEFVSETRGDWAQRKTGPARASMIARKAFNKAVAKMRADGEAIDGELSSEELAKIYRKGFGMLDMNRDWFVESFTPEPQPDINAQVTLIIDLSGSYDAFVAKTKQMFYDVRALLLRKYQKVTFDFVAFDGEAYSFKAEDMDKFFAMRLGGGTSYNVALKKTLEVQQNYPESQWDKFVLLAGDMEDYGEEDQVKGTLDKVRKNSQFFAALKMGYGRGGFGDGDFSSVIEKELKGLHESDPYVSFIDLAPENEYDVFTLKKLFKNKD